MYLFHRLRLSVHLSEYPVAWLVYNNLIDWWSRTKSFCHAGPACSNSCSTRTVQLVADVGALGQSETRCVAAGHETSSNRSTWKHLSQACAFIDVSETAGTPQTLLTAPQRNPATTNQAHHLKAARPVWRAERGPRASSNKLATIDLMEKCRDF